MSATSSSQTNPYIIDSPVSGDNLYDRLEAFQFVYESLAIPRNRILVFHGQSRIGKSSILQELHLHRLSSEEYITVWIDVRRQAESSFGLAIHNLAIQIAIREVSVSFWSAQNTASIRK